MFELEHQPICESLPQAGKAAILPWDGETFGFAVADYQLDSSARPDSAARTRQELAAWTETNRVEILVATVAAAEVRQISFLQRLGFHYVDSILRLRYERVASARYPAMSVTLSPARKEDLDAAMEIAGTVFETGHYHADARMPRHLADQRFRRTLPREERPGNNPRRPNVRSGIQLTTACLFR